MRDVPSVTDLIARANSGDQHAWDVLVERYAPLVWSICRRYRADGIDVDEVGQNVWLRLVDQLDRIREPAALPGWLVTTTERECARALRAARRKRAAWQMLEDESIPDERIGGTEHQLLAAERDAALREAFSCLPPRCQRLLALLTEDPPAPYAQISATLGIPVGSIGPTRSRSLDKLRRHPAIAALIHAEDCVLSSSQR